jgi:murein DD-endopeptidase MepM/ murein hydrolase activator NlpD
MRRISTREARRKPGFANGGIEGSGRLYVVLCAVLVLLVGTQVRAATLSNEVHRAPGPPVVVQDDSFTFPTTPVGQTSIECRGVCFCNAANCMCENSGTITIDKDLGLPFSAYEYSLQDWTTPANCDGGTPVQPPVFVPSGQRLNFKVSFSPTRPGTFNDSLTLDSYNLMVSGSTPTGPVTPGQAGVLYGVSDTANNGAILFSIANFSTNPQVNFIGETGLSFPAIAISPVSGIIYTVDPTTGYLFQLDAQSGASGFIGDTGLAQAGAVALACDAQGRIFTWGQNDGELYQLDPSSGAASAIGETGYAAGGDLAFDLNGTLYGSTGTDLITINPGSGAATYIGSFQTDSIFGLAIAADGTLYAGQATPGSTGQLYRVDKNNGQLTAVGGALSQSIGDIALFGSSSPRGTANLVPNTPPGWSAPLVVSTSAGSQTDGANLTSTEPLFLSWSLQNQGDLSTFGTFYADVDLDGSLLHRWQQDNPLSPQGQFSIDGYEFGPISAGTHTLELIPNSTNAVGITSSTYTKTITVNSSTPPSPLPLLFPLKASAPNRDRHLTPYSVAIITVFDHSMASTAHKNVFWPYGCNHDVVAFTGEEGNKKPSPSGSACGNHPGYSQSDGQAFNITGHYTGDHADGPTYLNYDGHPGFDYGAVLNTQVFAAVSGTVFYPDTGNALGLSDPFNTFHVLGIIPDDDPSYRVYYLHLSTHPSKSGTKGTFSDPSPAPGCPAQVALPLPKGTHVNAGCLIALSGKAGPPGTPAHLHFEVHKVLDLPEGSISAGSKMRCLADPRLNDSSHACVPVDPYGWIGSPPDPYITLTGVASMYLWAVPRP